MSFFLPNARTFFERPKFEKQDSLLIGNANTELCCIVATSPETNIGAHIERLIEESLKGIQALPHGKPILQNAAKVVP